MPNAWFQFKQFTVHQDRCAMKVTTDACLFGAWVAQRAAAAASPLQVFDIGAGTGLLTLMLAQAWRSARFTAVELDPAAAQQAGDNAACSPFADRITVQQADIRSYAAPQTYDLVVSNPPFHEQQLASPQAGRRQAHHDDTLTLSELLAASQRLVDPAGQLALLMPYYRKDEVLQQAAAAGFHAHQVCDVQQTPRHGCFRTMLLLGRQPAEAPVTEKLVITESAQAYSAEFVTLLRDYYLKL
jgi:tRNA1Val (adenine37-N6)-methyltransferase